MMSMVAKIRKDPVEEETDPTFTLGLPEADKAALSLAFGGVSSLLFLGSNFGAAIELFAQLPKKEKRDLSATGGMEPPTMCIKPDSGIRISDEPWKLEAWACWSNQKGPPQTEDASDAYRAREAYESLLWLTEHKKPWVVTVLYKLYGGIMPAHESSQLAFMGQLAPLALDTDIVLNWAAKLTTKLHNGLAGRNELVTPRTALESLLSGERKSVREEVIRNEAHKLAIRASNEYLKAKEAT